MVIGKQCNYTRGFKIRGGGDTPKSREHLHIIYRQMLDEQMKIIIDDYMKSKDNLMDMLIAYVKEHPEVDIEIIIPHRENMKKLLKEAEEWEGRIQSDE